MAQFNADDFFAIYIDSVRPGHIVPFDCYIHLAASGRAYLFIDRDTELEKDRYKKIKDKSYDKIYIRNEQKPLYYAYLESYFRSEEGSKVLQELNDSGDVSKIEGLPDPKEFDIKELANSILNDEQPDAKEVSPSEEESVKVQGSEKNFTSSVHVVSGGEEPGTVEPESAVEGELGDILKSLKSEIVDLEKVSLKSQKSESGNVKVIEDCTDYLNEEYLKIEGKIKNQESVDPQYLQSVKNKFKEHIQIIRENAGTENEEYINSSIVQITSQMDEIEVESQQEGVNPVQVAKKVRKLRGYLNTLNKLSKRDPLAIVSQSINKILGKVEHTLGEKVVLHTDFGEYGDIPEYLSQKLKLDDVTSSKSEDLKLFQHQIVKQGLLIQELTQKYRKSQSHLRSLKDEWFLFHVQAKRNLSGSDVMAAKKVNEKFIEVENDIEDLGQSSSSLMKVAADVTNDLGGKHLAIDPELLAKIGALSEDDQKKLSDNLENESEVSEKSSSENLVAEEQVENLVQASDGGDPNGQLDPFFAGEVDEEDDDDETNSSESSENSGEERTVTLGDLTKSTSQSGELYGEASFGGMTDEERNMLQQVQSENDVLRTQLENSQKLVEAGSLKISELTDLLDKNNELTEKLEEENEHYRLSNTKLEDEIQKHQTSEEMYHDNLSTADRGTKEAVVQSEKLSEQLLELKDQLIIKEQEVAALAKNSGLEDVVKTKDDFIAGLNKTLGMKRDEVTGLKKEMVKIKTEMSGSQQKFSQIAKKMNRMKVEYDNLKNSMRSAQAKAEGSKNSLQQARRTISKLTTMTEQLRKDRQTYIRKTNENLQKFKSMTSQAANLNRQVESGNKLQKNLENKLQASLDSEKALKKQLSDMQKIINSLQSRKAS